MGRHRRIQKKNRKKLKSVDPFNRDRNSIRETSKSRQLNAVPRSDDLDNQPMPRSTRELVQSLSPLGDSKRKRRGNRLLEETEKAGFVRRRFEGEGEFLRRIGTLTHHLVQEELMKAKFEIAGRDAKEIADDYKLLDEKAQRRKQQKAARRANLLAKKRANSGEPPQAKETHRVDAGGSSAHEGAMEETSKRQSRKQRQQLLRRKTREDDQADLLLNAREVIAFGERVDAPPDFGARCAGFAKAKNRMLKPKALTQVLGQVNTAGIKGTLLLNKEGVLLAYSGYGETNACVSAAIANSVWAAFEKHAGSIDDSLHNILIQCEHGTVAIAKVANLLLCMCAEEATPLGLLRAKLDALAQYLQEPLSQVASI